MDTMVKEKDAAIEKAIEKAISKLKLKNSTRFVLNFKKTNLTPQAQSSECNLPVPKRPLKGRFW